MHGCRERFRRARRARRALGLDHRPIVRHRRPPPRHRLRPVHRAWNRPQGSAADVFMRIHNPDGSEAGACGNATRCVVDQLPLRARTGRPRAGHPRPSPATCRPTGRRAADHRGHGRPAPGLARKSRWRTRSRHAASATSAGPVCRPCRPAPWATPTPPSSWRTSTRCRSRTSAHAWSTTRYFPERANIGFAQILAPDRIRLRVWERGAGLTLACGSGACAALVNAARRGLAASRAEMLSMAATLPSNGGTDGHVLMTGPVETSFPGTSTWRPTRHDGRNPHLRLPPEHL